MLPIGSGSSRGLGAAALAARAAGALGRIAWDRIEEARGRALPRTPEQLVRTDTLQRLLEHHAPPGAPPLPKLRSARLPGVHFESSNCTNFLIEVGFEGGPREGLPATLYAKLPCADRATRTFANAVGFWAIEAAFCARLASRVPIRVPRVYAVARCGSRFVLLLENLHEQPGARLFLNRDMAAGTTPERAERCLRSFAALHAPFWGLAPAERERLLPLRLHPYLAPGGRARSRALNAVAIAGAHRRAPDLFRREHVELCERAIAKWDAVLDRWFAEPLTLVHGDSHLGNCFEYPGEGGPRVGLIDFQGAHWGQGLRDVQYHLIDSLEPELLAGCESVLIDEYLAELARHGVTFDAERAREQYRALAFQTLMVAVVSLGLGSMTERGETLRTVLRRSVAAVERLDLAGWLAEL